jgi:hypothetical protein
VRSRGRQFLAGLTRRRGGGGLRHRLHRGLVRLLGYLGGAQRSGSGRGAREAGGLRCFVLGQRFEALVLFYPLAQCIYIDITTLYRT